MSETPEWVKIYETTSLAFASILKGTLEEEEIEVQLLNKQDSAYVPIGHVELYVLRHNTLKAIRIIESQNQ